MLASTTVSWIVADNEKPQDKQGNMIKNSPIPSWLETPPSSNVSPPVDTMRQELPFHELSWEDFEKLCLRIVKEEEKVEHCQIYGERGQNQEGIDLYARQKQSDKFSVYQCKRQKDYGPAKIEAAVKKFLEGEWVRKTETLVLCTMESLSRKERADKLEEQNKVLNKKGIKLIPWDSNQLSIKLKNLHETVFDFFGKAWVLSFCGSEQLNRVQEKNKIFLNISVNNEFSEDSIQGYFDADESETLKYKTTDTEALIKINPDMKYLNLLRAGGPIRGLDYWNSPFKWQFPKLDIKITNNTDKTIFFNRVEFNIEKSVTDPRAIILISENPYNTMHFLLVNEGWGDVKNCVINYNILPKGEKTQFGDIYPYSAHIGNFKNKYNVDLSNTLETLGVDVDILGTEEQQWLTFYNCSLKRIAKLESNPDYYGDKNINKFALEQEKRIIKHFQEKIDIEKAKRRRAAALGIFKAMDALVFGEIKYQHIDVYGETKRDAIKFSTLVSLVKPGPGAPIQPSYNYELMLRTDEENYKLDLPVSQALRPLDIDRFVINLGMPKSSLHKFKLKLFYNDSFFVESKLIHLHGFIPNSQKNRLKTDFEELRYSKKWRTYNAKLSDMRKKR